jgi:adenosyl cobinamide kinase/adenosyl cobinamide phosphate guanylyltransferase
MEYTHNAKTPKNARNSRTDAKYIATNSSTARNLMERIWKHQEKRLLTLL